MPRIAVAFPPWATMVPKVLDSVEPVEGLDRSQHALNQPRCHYSGAACQASRMLRLSWCFPSGKAALRVTLDEGQDQDSLRARSEQAIAEIAQALIDNPTLHNAITAAFGAREKAIEAQHAAIRALNLPSASDVERLERRLRSFSMRLEDVEERIDEISRELGALRRENAKNGTKKARS
jgi:hypothetical protein